MTAFPIRDTKDGARFLVRVTPRARRTKILGVHGEGAEAALRIALQAPPVEGRANAALVEFLAGRLDVPRSTLEISAGGHGRNKAILVRGHRAADIAMAIESTMAIGHR